MEALPLREQEKRERLEKKIAKALKEREPRKHLFDDNEFLDNREQMVEGVKNAVSDALKRSHPSSSASTSTVSESPAYKRQKTQSASTKKVAVSVFDDDDDDDSDEDDEDDEESDQEETTTSIPIKGKGKASTIKVATTIKA